MSHPNAPVVRRLRHRSVLLLLALALPLLSFATPAAAQSREDKEREARTACLGGDHAKGAMVLSELFVTTRNPTYIYNQGRCFEQNARYQEAISRFQEYLRVAKEASAEARAEAEQHIADCKAQLAERTPPAPAGHAPPARAPVPVVPPVSVLATPVASPAPATGSGLRTTGIVIGAAGLAALATGVALNLKANAMASDFEKFNGYTDTRESNRASYETWSWVGYGVGAACVGTGTLLYILGLKDGRGDSHTATIAPTTGGALFVLRGIL
jgi:hypothetical protein